MSDTPFYVGLIGCGAMGGQIAKAIQKDMGPGMKLIGLCDKELGRAHALSDSLPEPVPAVSLPSLVHAVHMVVEAAAGDVVPDVLRFAAAAGIDAMILSVGGLTKEAADAFLESGRTLYVPSGAAVGIDGLLAVREAGLKSVSIHTRRPPAALANSAYFCDRNLKAEDIKEEETIFNGPAEAAVRLFPENANVSTTLKLAGGVPVDVRITADPVLKSDIHEVAYEGDFCSISVKIENKPSPDNPGAGALACLSAIATLKKIASGIKIGT